MLQKPKGTQDIYDIVGKKYKYIQNYIDDFMKKYNYEYIKTPIFEVSELFKRTVGETTDIVSKETYDFLDKSGRSMTLRPEMTAGTVRSVIENKFYGENITNKFYYFGSCFRYERPQEGRLREFTQFGIEVFGNINPACDAQVISLGYKLIKSLGVENIVIKINTLGDNESRNEYNKVLKEYLDKNKGNLCEICAERIERNPIRVLDCKWDSQFDIVKNAPRTIDYLNESSKNYFDKVLYFLDKLNIPYEIDTNLVRGLDYYTHTVFEIVSNDITSNIGTICGGGRYDNLVSSLGGPNVPGVGFALGIERLLNFIKFEDKDKVDLFILNMNSNDDVYVIAEELRNSGYTVEVDFNNRNLKGQYKLIDKYAPKYVIMIGQDEIDGNYVTIRNNNTKETEKIDRDKLHVYLKSNI